VVGIYGRMTKWAGEKSFIFRPFLKEKISWAAGAPSSN